MCGSAHLEFRAAGGYQQDVESVRPLRVAVLSRYPLIRIGVTGLLHAAGDVVRVVDTASHDGHLSGMDAVLYDLAVIGDPDAQRDLQHLLDTVPVVGLTRQGNEDLGERARALGVGVLVPESVTVEELFAALYAATGRRGRPVMTAFDPRVLSERERAVLALVGAGLSNAQIARELIVSANTVKTYIRGAYRKIGVTTRPQAVLWVTHHGLGPTGRR